MTHRINTVNPRFSYSNIKPAMAYISPQVLTQQQRS